MTSVPVSVAEPLKWPEQFAPDMFARTKNRLFETRVHHLSLSTYHMPSLFYMLHRCGSAAAYRLGSSLRCLQRGTAEEKFS